MSTPAASLPLFSPAAPSSLGRPVATTATTDANAAASPFAAFLSGAQILPTPPAALPLQAIVTEMADVSTDSALPPMVELLLEGPKAKALPQPQADVVEPQKQLTANPPILELPAGSTGIQPITPRVASAVLDEDVLVEAPPADEGLPVIMTQPVPMAAPTASATPVAATPAGDSQRATALAAAVTAANPRAVSASGKQPGPNSHALEALAKHADVAPDSATTTPTPTPTPSSQAPLQRIATPDPNPLATADLTVASNASTNAAPAMSTPPTATSAFDALAAMEANAPTPLDADPVLAEPADSQSPDFPDEIGTRLSWLAERRIGHAQIRIAPPELGAVDVRLQVDGDQVKIDFSSPHPEVRAAIEASLPRLREQFDAQGMTLVQAGVGQHAAQREGDDAARSGSRPGEDGELADDAAQAQAGTRSQRGLLDEFA